MSHSSVGRAVRRLERQRAKKAGIEVDSRWYQFLVAASCPPAKYINIRNGIVSPAHQWGGIVFNDFLPDLVADFENTEETGMDLRFTNADFFLPIILCYSGDWIEAYTTGNESFTPIFDNVIGEEAQTATEAEAQIDGFLNGVDTWYYWRMPLWGVVFKNDGHTEIPYSIMPIDQTNRGRSYIYRDARTSRGAMP